MTGRTVPRSGARLLLLGALVFSLFTLTLLAEAPRGGAPAVAPETVAAPNPALQPADRPAAGQGPADADLLGAAPTQSGAGGAGHEKVPQVEAVNDPIEPFNRGIFGFNDWLIVGFFNPLEHGWEWLMPAPARESIHKAGANLAYPVRLLNTLLQGKFTGAAVETGRFLLNTTVGMVGLFDPATRLGMNAYNEDFGQTFGYYGAGPGFYLVLPVFGPSTGRDALGTPLDMPANPATYVPGLSTFFSFNKMGFSLPTYNNLRKVNKDPYAMTRDLWALSRQMEVEDFELKPARSNPAQTLGAIFLDVKDPAFSRRGKRDSARIPATDRWLPYTLWLQDHPAPLVFVVAGVGTHRESGSPKAIAEMVYRHGFSAVAISSSMNWEFMETASTRAVPGYTPYDADDVYKALNAIYQDVRIYHPGQITSTAFVGLSLGALHSLFIASFEAGRQPGQLLLDRYVAINPPVDMVYALSKLDEYYNAPLEWPAEEREARIRKTLYKAIKLAEGTLTPKVEALPFDYTESKFLIGLNYRYLLRDIIYSSQKRENQRGLKHPFNSLSRQDLYDEIAQYSFLDYIRQFVLPYYLYHSDAEAPRNELIARTNLYSIGPALKANPRVRVFLNENDFLLRPRDIDWFKKNMSDRLTVFHEGGHLGNLYQPQVQDKIMESLADLKDLKPREGKP